MCGMLEEGGGGQRGGNLGGKGVGIVWRVGEQRAASGISKVAGTELNRIMEPRAIGKPFATLYNIL